jgi:CHASE3 domain sensor protein
VKNIRFAKIAFLIAIGLSLMLGTLLSSNVRAIPNYTGLIETGRSLLKSVLEMQAQEQGYLLHKHEGALEAVKNEIEHLRKLVVQLEKTNLTEKDVEMFDIRTLEEAMDLCERLFDQFILHDQAVEDGISEIRNLEDSILAVIFSKMNPERGIIALQEVRIYEKRYLLYRGRSKSPEGRHFRDMRKKAVADLLMWAQKDKRIEELMAKDNQLFNEIINDYQGLDSALASIKTEREKITTIAEKFLEVGKKRLHTINRRCAFLTTILLVMWLVAGVVVITTRFSG